MHRRTATIEIVGHDGRRFRVSGPGQGGEGVVLANSPDDLHVEAPITPIYQQGAFQEGATYLGHTVEPKDLVLGFVIDPPFNQDSWEEIESYFFGAFDPVKYARIEYTTPDGEMRYLNVRKHAAMKIASEKDPRIANMSNMVVTLRADWPYWRSPSPVVYSGKIDTGGSAEFTVSNPTDLDLWLKWTLTAPGKWRVPDYCLTADEGTSLRTRRVITPNLTDGQHLTIDTYPRRETYISADGSNIAGRFAGIDFLYPVPPHTPPTTYTVTYEGDGTGTFQCRQEHNWLRPWGGRR